MTTVVPGTVFQGFLAAPSKGPFVNRNKPAIVVCSFIDQPRYSPPAKAALVAGMHSRWHGPPLSRRDPLRRG
jgi:hypothetical protein